ncbi:glucuronate isomerase [Cryobacterium melibiosiphilum]|uniref:Uronate isomerase n=1 Tax=Cryobacterium melibiosiphilum TaxID=995039 RepID=A0A3A5MCA8_9MICO|nr:glucuronate isomerase [Cryobacterium melibiosiphilum]RJT86243.1 glucuronate isomerase [Cryobacterium melibiosiphilum]
MKLELDPDRLFPVDPATRDVARGLYAEVATLPILSPHGHVDPAILLHNVPFLDSAELLIRYDHYVTRLMHAAGVPLTDLGIADSLSPAPIASPREAWRTFCAHWHLYAGTASGYWLQHEFSVLFGIDRHPDASNADALFDLIQTALATEAFRPRALFTQFGIEVLATTDDPMDDLAVHRALVADASFTGRVVPTFRPDAYLNPAASGFADGVARLAEWNGTAPGSYRGYIEALAGRRRYFVDHGAVSADHGVLQPLAVDMPASEAAALFERARGGALSDVEAQAFAGHMLLEMARMSVDDGLVMTVHPGVFRNHNTDTFRRFGPDMGHDIPVTTTYVDPLRPLLEKFGNLPDFHLVLFAVDETAYSREIAPLAGFYPSVYVGAPWWFLDAPDAVLRFRAAVTETAGFYRGSGFIDDTRAFLSIPARHEMARRLDAAFLARLVREGRIDRPTAERIIVDLVDTLPRKVFKL